jgi:hypothetical protein
MKTKFLMSRDVPGSSSICYSTFPSTYVHTVRTFLRLRVAGSRIKSQEHSVFCTPSMICALSSGSRVVQCMHICWYMYLVSTHTKDASPSVLDRSFLPEMRKRVATLLLVTQGCEHPMYDTLLGRDILGVQNVLGIVKFNTCDMSTKNESEKVYSIHGAAQSH